MILVREVWIAKVQITTSLKMLFRQYILFQRLHVITMFVVIYTSHMQQDGHGRVIFDHPFFFLREEI